MAAAVVVGSLTISCIVHSDARPVPDWIDVCDKAVDTGMDAWVRRETDALRTLPRICGDSIVMTVSHVGTVGKDLYLTSGEGRAALRADAILVSAAARAALRVALDRAPEDALRGMDVVAVGGRGYMHVYPMLDSGDPIAPGHYNQSVVHVDSMRQLRFRAPRAGGVP